MLQYGHELAVHRQYAKSQGLHLNFLRYIKLSDVKLRLSIGAPQQRIIKEAIKIITQLK
jgi:hypothetical protein